MPSPSNPCRRNFLPEFLRDFGLPCRSKLDSGWTVADGFQIHARSSRGRTGEIPFVLVHGLVISSLYLIPLAECLSQCAPVHAPDQPGFGRSEGPEKAPDVEEMARLLILWMDSAQIQECHLVANSLGCQIATSMAIQAPERFRSLVLIGPTVAARKRGFWQQTARIVWDAPHEPVQLWMNHLVDQFRAGCSRIWQMIFHMLADRIEDRLPSVTQPTLVIRGEHDPSAPAAWVEDVVRLLPRGKGQTLPGWHCVHYTRPDLTAEVIKEFVGNAGSSSSGVGKQ